MKHIQCFEQICALKQNLLIPPFTADGAQVCVITWVVLYQWIGVGRAGERDRKGWGGVGGWVGGGGNLSFCGNV